MGVRVNINNFNEVVDAPYIGRATVKIVGKPTLKKFNSGTEGIKIRVKIVDAVEQASGMNGLGKQFGETLFIPNDGMGDGGEFCALTMRKFCNCFKIETDTDGFDLDALTGAEGDVIFSNVEEEYKGEKKMVNKITSYLKPTDPAAGGTTAPGEDW